MEYQFSKGMNQVFNNSRNEAKRLQSEFLNTEHLLLGIIKSENSSAYAILEDFNADLTQIRRKIESLNITSNNPNAMVTEKFR